MKQWAREPKPSQTQKSWMQIVQGLQLVQLFFQPFFSRFEHSSWVRKRERKRVNALCHVCLDITFLLFSNTFLPPTFAPSTKMRQSDNQQQMNEMPKTENDWESISVCIIIIDHKKRLDDGARQKITTTATTNRNTTTSSQDEIYTHFFECQLCSWKWWRPKERKKVAKWWHNCIYCTKYAQTKQRL